MSRPTWHDRWRSYLSGFRTQTSVIDGADMIISVYARIPTYNVTKAWITTARTIFWNRHTFFY